jgi:RNA polymerase sigma factor (sigma-70 family)
MAAVGQPELVQLMDVVREVARSLAARLKTCTVDVEELEADGFEGLVKALDDYDSEKGPLVPYVVVRCRGAMIDGLRRKMRTSRRARAGGVEERQVLSLDHEVDEGLRLMDVIVDPTSPTPEEASVSTAAPTVQSALATLPKRHQRVLVLRFLGDRPRQEIAAVEGISVGRLAEIEKRFRDRLRPPRQRPETLEPPSDMLTDMELTVLRLAAAGGCAEETARWLRRGLETVKSQRCRIIAKLRARNMINAVAISYQRGLL